MSMTDVVVQIQNYERRFRVNVNRMRDVQHALQELARDFEPDDASHTGQTLRNLAKKLEPEPPK